MKAAEEKAAQEKVAVEEAAAADAAAANAAVINDVEVPEHDDSTDDDVREDYVEVPNGGGNGGGRASASGLNHSMSPERFALPEARLRDEVRELYECNLDRVCRKVPRPLIVTIYLIHFCEQVTLWENFPDYDCPRVPSMDGAGIQSVATHLRDRGSLTTESAHLLADVAAWWAGVKVTLACDGQEPFEAGNLDARVVLVLNHGKSLESFDIKSEIGLVHAPQRSARDPVSSNCLLRAIAWAASLAKFGFPCTVYPEEACELALPLPLAAKPIALTIAQCIWNRVTAKVPGVKLGDHTEKDSMGSTNLGTMFKVCSLLLAQGALCKYRLSVIAWLLTMFFLAIKMLCTWVLGLASRLGFSPRLRNRISKYSRLSDTCPTTTFLPGR
jgi:hypothetical protein